MSKVSKVVFGNETIIDISGDSVDSAHLLSGYTAHGSDGEAVAGGCTYDADTRDATATAAEILDTKTAYKNGVKIVGNMPNRGAVSGTISDVSTPYTIPQGYHDGSGVCSIDSVEAQKIIPGNIRNGVSILSVVGSYAGEAVPTQAKSATPYTTQQVILPDSGYNLSQVTVAAISYTTAANVGGGLTATIGAVAPA